MKIVRTVIFAVILISYGTFVFAWNCPAGVRYKDNGNGTVTDCELGLVWLKNAKCTDTINGVKPDSYGRLSWDDAAKWTAGLRSGRCGLKDGSKTGDWRLPSMAEWIATVASAKSKGYTDPALTNAAGNAQWTKNGDAFDHVESFLYWTSTSDPDDPGMDAVFLMSRGDFINASKDRQSKWFNVWPVRR